MRTIVFWEPDSINAAWERGLRRTEILRECTGSNSEALTSVDKATRGPVITSAPTRDDLPL